MNKIIPKILSLIAQLYRKPHLSPRPAILKELVASTETILQHISREQKSTSSYNKLINVFNRNNNKYKSTDTSSNKVVITNIRKKLKDNNLIVSKADKGNSTIILNRLEYVNITKTFLSNNNFII